MNDYIGFLSANDNKNNNLLLPHYIITPDSFNDIMSKSRKISREDNNSIMLRYTRTDIPTKNCMESV